MSQVQRCGPYVAANLRARQERLHPVDLEEGERPARLPLGLKRGVVVRRVEAAQGIGVRELDQDHAGRPIALEGRGIEVDGAVSAAMARNHWGNSLGVAPSRSGSRTSWASTTR